MSVRWIVVGIGSPHGWDSLGWQVIDLLAQMQVAAELIKCDGSGLDWVNRVQPHDQLIFVDALAGPGEPGVIVQHPLTRDSFAACPATVSSHGFGLHYSFKLGSALGVLPPTITVFGALAKTGELVEHEVRAAAVELATRIFEHLTLGVESS